MTSIDASAQSLRNARDRAIAGLPAHLSAAVDLRHRIHADPRVSGNEYDTAELIARELQSAIGPIDRRQVAEGWVGRIGPDRGPAVAVRAELDALPVHEDNDVAWRSTHPGVAHLCGHDVHMASLYAAACALSAAGPPVPLLMILQPREETLPCGAKDVVDAGVLQQHQVRALLGVHLQPQIPDGTFSAVAGTINASADEFTVTVRGVPGHGAYPHLSRDAVVATGNLIVALQHVVSRRSDPMSPTVLSIGSVHGGSSFNAIPAEVELRGTVRAYTEQQRTQLIGSLTEVARHVAAAHGCEAEVSIGMGEPPLVNDRTLSAAVGEALSAAGHTGAAALRSCGADDFSFYGTIVPSLMIFAGVGPADGTAPGLHHPRFLPPDRMVETVARVMIDGYVAAAAHVSDRES